MQCISISDVSKTYPVYRSPLHRLGGALLPSMCSPVREVKALCGVSLDIKKGETLGIVGRNGSGKSTLLQLLCGTLQPSSGKIDIQGRISALLELGAGFNPEFNGRENIFLNAAILGLSREETRERYEDIVSFSGLERHYLEQPVKTYSSGMYVRLAFAIAVAVDPDILIVDEALAVGDEAFQRKCFARIRSMQEKGATILFVAHSGRTIIDLCSRAVMLEHGRLMIDDDPKTVVNAYHRFIFAAQEKQPAILEAIEQGASLDDAAMEASDIKRPESMEAYAPRGGQISDAHFTDLSGTVIDKLETGTRYQYRYTVTFDETVERVTFAMMFKTKQGKHLGGMKIGDANDAPIARIEAGTVMEVCFEFTCNVLPETYYTNSSVHAESDDETYFVHRVVDHCQMTVMPQPSQMQVGTVDFAFTTSLVETTEQAA